MDKSEVCKVLESVKELKDSHIFYDMHAHPFEMMYEQHEYRSSQQTDGLYSVGNSKYSPPSPNAVNLEAPVSKDGKPIAASLLKKVNLLNARRYYAHTGSRVFADEMELCSLDRVLLLSVMQENESGDTQLQLLNEMFGGDERFMFAYCLPNDIPNRRVADEVQRVIATYTIKSLKIHPSVTGIDLTRSEGIERVETILDASRRFSLPVVIHGGRSPDCPNSQAIAFGTAENLQHVDWAITKQTVDIAHGGFFSHAPEEARETVVPIMVDMLDRHDNLIVDTSGVDYELICLMLKHYDLERMVFGSDALYIKQWMALVRLWCALRDTLGNCEENLLRLASSNPEKLFHF